MGMFGNKKTWFSYVRHQSPCVLKFTSDVMDSKYDLGTNEDTGYEYRQRYFETRDDSPEGTYLVIESEDLEEQVLEIPKNTWVKVDANLDDGRQVIEYSPVEADSGPPKGQTATGEGSYTYPSAVDRYTDCLRAARQVAEKAGLSEDDSPEIYWEFVRNVATHFSMDFARGDTAPHLTSDGNENQANDAQIDVITGFIEKIDWSGSYNGKNLSAVLDRIEHLIDSGNLTPDEASEIATFCNEILEDQQEDEVEKAMGGEDDLPF